MKSARDLSRSQKTLVGALTLWPAAYIAVFFIVWLSTFITIGAAAFGIPLLAPGALMFCCIFPLHILTMALIVGMTIYWGIQVYGDPVIVGDQKVLWMMAVIAGGTIGQAAYFFVNIWPEKPTTA